LKHLEIPIIYSDEHIIAVDKPAGVLTIPDRFDPDMPNLLDVLTPVHGTLLTIHRLDKYTSGINLFARNAAAHRTLSLAFESRDVEKYYYAIVDGLPNPESGRIEVPLAESTVNRGKMLVHPRGKMAITEYKIVKKFRHFSLIYLRIHTGRMHQIRVHMQYLGYPLIVDSLYGRRDAFFLSEIKQKKFHLGKYQEEKALLTRQPLHAASLILNHPVTNDRITLTSELPKDMRAVLNQLEKWNG
jgi:RluA family pseudouridine synthase